LIFTANAATGLEAMGLAEPELNCGIAHNYPMFPSSEVVLFFHLYKETQFSVKVLCWKIALLYGQP
jgi:hypothetical protein